MPDQPNGPAKTRYNELTGARSFYLTEAKQSADLTVPAIMPDTQDVRDIKRNQRQLQKPYQSLGARGVNNLASKLLLTLLPPTSPFFRFEIDPKVFAGVPAEEEGEVKADLQRALAKRERQIIKEIDTQGMRVKAFSALKHLLITGNVCLYLPPDGGMQLFPLNSFVVSRDGEGNVVELLYVEVLDRQTVPERIRSVLSEEPQEDFSGKDASSRRKNVVQVYTWVTIDAGRVKFRQELSNGTVIPQSQGDVPVAENPWLVLPFTLVDGEDYGRGFIEEYRGDLASLETLSKALQFAAVNAAKLIVLTNPNGTVSIRALKKAENGEVLTGQEGDVTFLRLDKGPDMAFALQMRQDLHRDLSADFLLNSSFQRPGERVTAEEIRRMAEELEDSLGGVFSMLSQTFQLPLARRLEGQLVKRGAIKKIPRDQIEPAVVTGLAAIGRGHDLERLRVLLSMIAEASPVIPGLALFFDREEIAKRLGNGSGVDVDGLLKTAAEVEQEVAAAQQTAQRQNMAQSVIDKATGPLAKGLADANTPASAQSPQR